jgi:hypothetical protein
MYDSLVVLNSKMMALKKGEVHWPEHLNNIIS